ncbi:SpoIIE family protein phosphatase [Patescibacteria group bacterium]|nr:SpoIIE family protein phosphatase [Patescibacteria group bacterium]MBU2613280.1 SpoIIE family protein phosphatase [Patescibacteria group bacterium]
MHPENPFLPDAPEAASERPKDLQAFDVVETFEVAGFDSLEVATTMEKGHDAEGEKDSRNGDAILADAKTGLLGVFDGLGGQKHADRASQAASLMLASSWKRALTSWNGKTDLIEEALTPLSDMETLPWLRQDSAFARKAHAMLVGLEWAHASATGTGGMTTACVGFVHTSEDGARRLVTANVGDSGAFILRSGGGVERASPDESILGYLLAVGAIDLPLLYRLKKEPDTAIEVPSLGRKDSYYDMANTVIRPLGGPDSVRPRITVKTLLPDDVVIFCTDGVIDKYENVISEIPPEREMREEQMDLGGFESAAAELTVMERVESLRKDAAERVAYKITDDIGIVGIRVLKD